MRAVLVALLAGGVALLAQAPVPRPMPELKIVSADRGRVLLLAFISTECPHCQRVSGVLEELSHEFEGKLAVAAVAFNEGADTAAFAKRFRLSFPVGTATSDAVHDFLGIARASRIGTPQMVAIDKHGVIRAQSERPGTPMLQAPEYLRVLVRSLMELR